MLQSVRKVHSSSAGFTLVELVVVVFLLGAMVSVFARRFTPLVHHQEISEIRKFANLWQMLEGEASSRGDIYRLVINLDEEYYTVRREVPLTEDEIRNVDNLKNLRLRSQKKRLAEAEEERLLDTEQEYAEEDRRLSGAVDDSFFEFIYSGSPDQVRLTAPLQFPELAKRNFLPDSLKFYSANFGEEQIRSGEVSLRFTPRAGGTFAVIQIVGDKDTIYSVYLNPESGEMVVAEGARSFNWTEFDSDKQK